MEFDLQFYKKIRIYVKYFINQLIEVKYIMNKKDHQEDVIAMIYN